MYLNCEEEATLSGEFGTAKQKAMEILVALGDIYGADKLIPVESSQIAGVSYKTIGEAGLEYLTQLNGRVVIPTTLNPMGMDKFRWKELGISADFHAKQMDIIENYERLGINSQCTCTPYYKFAPLRGSHISWSESSAVSYANSVLGARTNREGGPSALASALIGKTPNYGYHLDENRIPTLLIKVNFELKDSDYGALGYIVGKLVEANVPSLFFVSIPKNDDLKALGASMAATGAVALYHINKIVERPVDVIEVERGDLDIYSFEEPDIVAIGCPHCSQSELMKIARLLEGKTVKRPLWICTSREVAHGSSHIVEAIENSGAKVICDTCMVVSPAFEGRKMMVNSGKAFAYGPSLCKSRTSLCTTQRCIDAACSA
ncbi:MAG: aconitase X catalytic domain-containing protein [Halobacteriota archaeon]